MHFGPFSDIAIDCAENSIQNKAEDLLLDNTSYLKLVESYALFSKAACALVSVLVPAKTSVEASNLRSLYDSVIAMPIS